MQIFLKVLITVITLLYPLTIYFGLQHFDPRHLVLVLFFVVITRALTTDKSVTNHWLWLPVFLVLIGWTWIDNSDLGLKLYPVIINANLLLLFALSLRSPMPIIERLARLQEPDLPPEAVIYTRTVTKVWCGFFIINGSIAAYTVVLDNTEIWALYNGLISYGLMGLLMAGEYLVRLRVKRQIDA